MFDEYVITQILGRISFKEDPKLMLKGLQELLKGNEGTVYTQLFYTGYAGPTTASCIHLFSRSVMQISG